MIISLEELVESTRITEDASGRKVFSATFTTQEILINTDNIVSVRPVDGIFAQKLTEAKVKNLPVSQFSSVFLNKGGVNSTDIVVVGSPREIMSKLNKKVLLND